LIEGESLPNYEQVLEGPEAAYGLALGLYLIHVQRDALQRVVVVESAVTQKFVHAFDT